MSLWPLAGARVVDASRGVAGLVCGKILADAGASVATVSLPVPDPAPLPQGHWRGFLDLDKTAADGDPHELLADTHLFLTSATHAAAATPGLDCESLLARHPQLVCACVTPFGQSGPYAGFVGDDLAVSALSGLADATPGFPDLQVHEGEPPVQSLAPLVEMAGGITAAGAVFGPLLARLRGVPGARHVEISSLEAATAMLVWEWGMTAYGGGVRGRRPGHGDLEPNCCLPCRDGWVVIVAFTEKHWRALVEIMGEPAWADDPRFSSAVSRAEHWEPLHARLREWAAAQHGDDILVAAQARGLPCAPSFELADTLASDHVHATGAVRHDGLLRFPADPVVVGGRRRSGRPPAPPPRTRPSEPAPPERPLAGVRVLDLSQVVAGPYAGQLLAALGAEVVLVESSAHPVSRGFGPFVGEPAHDASMMFNQVNRGKRSVEINLTDPAGRELLDSLVRISDVVLENFSGRAAAKLRLTYDALRAVRDDIILASISGFGRSGPWGDYVALHSGIILMSGLASVTRDGHGRPRMAGAIYPDLLTGAYMAVAIQEALAARETTGEGCALEVSMLDVILTCMGGLVPEAEAGRSFPTHPGQFVPTTEQNRFIAVPAGEEQAAAGRTRREAMEMLQARGVPAAAVLDAAELMCDPHLVARGFVVEDDHPVAGNRLVPAVPWLVDGSRPALRHAPCLGEATNVVLREIAGIPADEIEALRAGGTLA